MKDILANKSNFQFKREKPEVLPTQIVQEDQCVTIMNFDRSESKSLSTDGRSHQISRTHLGRQFKNM